MPQSLATATIVAALSAAQAAAQAGSMGAVDTLDRAGRSAIDFGAATRVVIGSYNSLSEPPTLQVFDASAGSFDFARTAIIDPPSFIDWWQIEGIDVEDGLIVHAISKPFGIVPELAIHEETPNGWTTELLELPGARWRPGELARVSGERIVVATTPGFFRPVSLQIIERAPSGGWHIVDSVQTDVDSPWWDDEINVVLEGDIAAVGQVQGADLGRVAVCERTANGWAQTATLDPPEPVAWPVHSISIDGGVIAVGRSRLTQAPGTAEVVHLYERDPSGEWRIANRVEVSAAWSHLGTLDVELDGDRLAVAADDMVRIFRRASGGAMTLERTLFRPRQRLTAFVDGRVAVRSGNFVTAAMTVLDLDASPGVESVPLLRGLRTCEGTGAAKLFVHEDHGHTAPRRAVAEVTGASPGATVVVLRSVDPGRSAALGGLLCIDRSRATLAGPVRAADSNGRVTVPLAVAPDAGEMGYEFAHHLQAIVLSSAPELTNSLAWLP